MGMKTTALSLLLLVAACGSDVDLELEISDPETSPVSPGEPPASPPVGELFGYFIHPGLESSEVDYLMWADDGSLVAAGGFARADLGVGTGGDAFLARLAADGVPLWVREIDWHEALDLANQCCGFDASELELKAAFTSIDSIDTFDNGEILVALNLRVAYENGEFGGEWASFGFVQRYDADGALLATRGFPAADSGEEIVDISGVLALPDGGAALIGATGNGESRTGSVVARLDPGGELAWTTSIVSSDRVRNLAATPDGGIAFQGSFVDEVVIGERSAAAPSGVGVFVARVEQDGACTWIQSFDGADLLTYRGGVSVEPAGNLFVAGNFVQRMSAGGLELADSGDDHGHYLAELDASGEVLRLNQIEELSAVFGDRSDVQYESLSLAGDTLAIGGNVHSYAVFALIDRSGHLLAAQSLSVTPPESSEGAAGSRAIAAAHDGRVAVGGFWEDMIDLGAGKVLRTVNPLIGEAFIGVYQPSVGSGTVDLVTP